MSKRSFACKRRNHLLFSIALSFFLGISLSGCKGKEPAVPDTKRQTVTEILSPYSDGSEVNGNDSVSIDTSNISEGYFMIQYKGSAEKSRIQVTTPDETIYSYCLLPGDYETFPLSGGSGTYQIDVYEHAYDTKYALSFSETISVKLSDDFRPFLYPNQYCRFTEESLAVQYGIELSDQSSDDLDYVENVFHYVTTAISYDTELAKDLPADYIPDLDQTMETKKGICFDYASLMCAFLRSQQIPTKLVAGYSGTTYHAWISVYLEESGWVDNMIEFDGKDWSLMDPTLAAGNQKDSVKNYVGDGSNYIVKYSY